MKRRSAGCVRKMNSGAETSLGIVAVAGHITDNNGMPMIRSVPAQESRGDTVRIDVSVVTPSFNMLNYLQRCCASVADQEYVTHEHIVVDGGSTDETPEWLSCLASLISQSQRDNGMYDAVNRGFRLARGEIVSHLNCDEQLLPDTLHFVRRFFREHPEVDVLFGDILAVRPDGGLIAYRKMMRRRSKPVHLVLDGLPAHKTTLVKTYVTSTKGMLTLHFLPGYAPELNPDELVWSHMKRTGAARAPLQRGEKLQAKIEAQLGAIRRMPRLIRSFF